MNMHEWRNHVLCSKVSSHAKLLAFALAQHFVQGKPTYPGNTTLAEKTSTSESTIKKCKKELKAAGLIEYYIDRLPGKSNDSTFYKFIGVEKFEGSPYDQSNNDQSLNNQSEIDQSFHRSPYDPEVYKVNNYIKRKKYIKKQKGEKDLRVENDRVEKFTLFWEAYGKIGNKQKAENAFEKINESELSQVMDGVKKYKIYILQNSWYNIRHASSWLNQRGWEDAYNLKPAALAPLSEEEKLMQKLGCINFEMKLKNRGSGMAVSPDKIRFLENWEKTNNQKVTWNNLEEWKKLQSTAPHPESEEEIYIRRICDLHYKRVLGVNRKRNPEMYEILDEYESKNGKINFRSYEEWQQLQNLDWKKGA